TSLMTLWNGFLVRSSRSSLIFSNSLRVSVSSKNTGFFSESTVMYGRLIDVDEELDSSILARSAASRTRGIAILSFVRSRPVLVLKLLTIQSTKIGRAHV